jgi:hypothetical protein
MADVAGGISWPPQVQVETGRNTIQLLHDMRFGAESYALLVKNLLGRDWRTLHYTQSLSDRAAARAFKITCKRARRLWAILHEEKRGTSISCDFRSINALLLFVEAMKGLDSYTTAVNQTLDPCWSYTELADDIDFSSAVQMHKTACGRARRIWTALYELQRGTRILDDAWN